MAIVNRRNAVVGWVVLKRRKAVARRKARQARERLAFWHRNSG